MTKQVNPVPKVFLSLVRIANIRQRSYERPTNLECSQLEYRQKCCVSVLLTVSQGLSQKGNRFVVIAQKVLDFTRVVLQRPLESGKSYNGIK